MRQPEAEPELILVPRARISSRLFEIAEGEFDIDLNALDIDEHDPNEERFLNNFILDVFENKKRD